MLEPLETEQVKAAWLQSLIGFIRAEGVAHEELEGAGSYAAAQKKGLVRLEGKEYIVQDGDVIFFRFHV